MGLFKRSSAPVEPPEVERQDLAEVISGAPATELRFLRQAQPEIDYLEDLLPGSEQILAASTCDYDTSVHRNIGFLVVTPRRVVAVLGKHGGRDKDVLMEEPVVLVFPHADVTFRAWEFAGHMTSTFTLPGQSDVQLQIGWDLSWGRAVVDVIKQQLNRARLA